MTFRSALYFCLGVGVLSSLALRAGVEVLRGDLFGRVIASAEADSNIYLSALEQGDFLVTVAPEVGFKRDIALILVDLSAGLSIKRFVDHSENNDENPFASAAVRWAPERGKSEAQFSASARQVAQANQDVNQRTVSDNYTLNGSFGHFVTEKLGYRFRSSYTDQNYATTGLSDVLIVQAGLDARHQYSPKLENFLGYAFRDTTTDRHRLDVDSIDSSDHQVLAGLEGDLLPKVTGRFAAGLVTRRFALTRRSETGLLLDSALTWKWRERLGITLNARRDFDTSGADQSILGSRFAVGAQLQLRAQSTLAAEGGYAHRDYTGGAVPRVDRTYDFNARYTFAVTARVLGSAYVSYRTTDSTSDYGTYDQALAGVSVSMKL